MKDKEIVDQLEIVLENEIGIENDRFSKKYGYIAGAQRFTQMNPVGKKYRGKLLLLSYYLVKLKSQTFDTTKKLKEQVIEALPLAVSIEFCQTAMLIQDDVIDGGNKRRNGKAVHVYIYEDLLKGRFEQPVSEEITLLLGNIVFSYIFERIMKVYGNKKYRYVIDEFQKMIYTTLQGEVLDIVEPLKDKCIKYDKEQRKKIAEEIDKLKTAVYSFSYPLIAGFMLAGGIDIETEKETVFAAGEELGIAYQIYNDWADIKKMLKNNEITTDISRYRITYAIAVLRENDEMNRIFGRAQIGTEDGTKILKYVQDNKDSIRKKIEKKCQAHLETAHKKLNMLNFIEKDCKAILLKYIDDIFLNLKESD